MTNIPSSRLALTERILANAELVLGAAAVPLGTLAALLGGTRPHGGPAAATYLVLGTLLGAQGVLWIVTAYLMRRHSRWRWPAQLLALPLPALVLAAVLRNTLAR